MISVCITYFYAIYIHYEHRSGQSKKECSYPVPSIFDIIICGFTPSVRMFIGQGLSLEARRAAQAERRSANTTTAPASVAAAAAAASTTAAAAANERASSASPPLFALSPTAEMDSIASLPTGASADGPPSPASIAGSLTGSLVPLVYVEDFCRKHNRSVRALVIMCHGLTHNDGPPAINVSAAPWSE